MIMKEIEIENYLEKNLKSHENDIMDSSDRLVWLSDVKKVVKILLESQNIRYELVSENLTNLGGMMGTESTYDNWRKPFTNVKDAKKYAEKDYGKKINWRKSGTDFCSGDLSYVMYHIKELKVVK